MFQKSNQIKVYFGIFLIVIEKRHPLKGKNSEKNEIIKKKSIWIGVKTIVYKLRDLTIYLYGIFIYCGNKPFLKSRWHFFFRWIIAIQGYILNIISFRSISLCFSLHFNIFFILQLGRKSKKLHLISKKIFYYSNLHFGCYC